MKAVIFAGPSLPPSVRPDLPGFSWRPPARQGDVYRAALERPAAIGLVDGYFETVLGVWHKEILWALSQGIRVFGSSSVGALRAVELEAFGMRGVGRVFEDFRDQVLQDDDEVALLHAPEVLDYRNLTAPMVNIRATVSRAVRCGAIDPTGADSVLRAAKSQFYKERTWRSALQVAAADRESFGRGLATFECWLTHNILDQKRADAVRLVAQVARTPPAGNERWHSGFELAISTSWQTASRDQ